MSNRQQRNRERMAGVWGTISGQAARAADAADVETLVVPLDRLEPLPAELQPRRDADEGEMRRLEADVKRRGLLTPLLVRPLPSGRYQIVGGGRRYTVAQRLGLETVRVQVQTIPDDQVRMYATADNIFRKGLSPIEEGYLFQAFLEDGYTYREIADEMQQPLSTIARRVRLVTVPGAIDAWQAGLITQDQLISADFDLDAYLDRLQPPPPEAPTLVEERAAYEVTDAAPARPRGGLPEGPARATPAPELLPPVPSMRERAVAARRATPGAFHRLAEDSRAVDVRALTPAERQALQAAVDDLLDAATGLAQVLRAAG